MYYSSLTSDTFCCSHISRKLRHFVYRFARCHGAVSASFFVFVFIITAFIDQPLAMASSSVAVAEDYHRLGYDAQQNADYPKALAYYMKAASANPKNASYWNDIGLVHEMLGDPERAETAYLRALRLDSKYLAPYSNLAQLYQKRQNRVKTVYYLQKRIELGDPADPWTKKARQDLEDIYINTPLYRERFLEAETSRLNLQATQESRDNFRNQIKVATAEYERGMELLKKQKIPEAIKAFNDSLAFAPGNPKAVQARAEAQKVQRAQRAEQAANEAMGLLKEGKEQAARKKFNEILAIIPNQTD